jgi:hypothetical protein
MTAPVLLFSLISYASPTAYWIDITIWVPVLHHKSLSFKSQNPSKVFFGFFVLFCFLIWSLAMLPRPASDFWVQVILMPPPPNSCDYRQVPVYLAPPDFSIWIKGTDIQAENPGIKGPLQLRWFIKSISNPAMWVIFLGARI